MKVLKFKDFVKKKLKNDTTVESHLRRVYSHPISSRYSKIYSDKGIVIIDDGSQEGLTGLVFL